MPSATKNGLRRSIWLIPLILIVWAGANTYRDFEAWLADYTPAIGIDDRFNEGMAVVREQTPATMPLVIPGIVYHPVAAFHGYGMPQREIIFYEWPDGDCYATPREPYVALDLPINLNSFERRAQPYSVSLHAIARHPQQHYNAFIVQPNADLTAAWDDNSALLGGLLEVKLVEPVTQRVAPGETLPLHLGIRVHNTPQQAYRFFVHLQGDPTPYDGGPQWSTGDTPLCRQLYNPQWNTDMTLVQSLALPIPADILAGEYHVAIGLYDPQTGARLPVTPAQNEHDYYEALRFVVP